MGSACEYRVPGHEPGSDELRPLLSATLLNFFGYLFISWFYRGVIPIRSSDDIDTPASPLLLGLLILAMFMTGAAGSAGLAAGMNAVAKSFPDKLRASATGSVLAGFGLSAFFFSQISRTLGGSTSGFLRVLAIGTAVPMFIGAILVRPYPPAQAAEYEPVHCDDPDEHRDADLGLSRQVSLGVPAEAIADRFGHSNDLELARSSSGSLAHRTHEHEHEHDGDSSPPTPTDPLLQRGIGHKRYDSNESLPPTAIHYSPLDLIGRTDWYLLFSILAILCGIGLEWINNVGVSRFRSLVARPQIAPSLDSTTLLTQTGRHARARSGRMGLRPAQGQGAAGDAGVDDLDLQLPRARRRRRAQRLHAPAFRGQAGECQPAADSP